MKTKQLFCTSGDACYKFNVLNKKKIKKELIPDLSSCHEEADTRLVYHLSKQSCGNMVVTTSDTDVVVIILGSIHKISEDIIIRADIGNRRFLNLNSLRAELVETLCKALPGFYAFRGCMLP